MFSTPKQTYLDAVASGRITAIDALEGVEIFQLVRAQPYKHAKDMQSKTLFVDKILLGQAAQSGGLEATEDSCEYLTKYYIEAIDKQLNGPLDFLERKMMQMQDGVSTYVEVINAYGCGDETRLKHAVRASASYFEEDVQQSRNAVIAESIHRILKAAPATPTFTAAGIPRAPAFAVGLAHWLNISSSVDAVSAILEHDYGYTVARTERFDGKSNVQLSSGRRIAALKTANVLLAPAVMMITLFKSFNAE